jgi:hypothetical protein
MSDTFTQGIFLVENVNSRLKFVKVGRRVKQAALGNILGSDHALNRSFRGLPLCHLLGEFNTNKL